MSTNVKIVNNMDEFKELVKDCESVKEPASYPCAVCVVCRSGYGKSWKNAIVVVPPNYTDVEQMAYLRGVVKSWEIMGHKIDII